MKRSSGFDSIECSEGLGSLSCFGEHPFNDSSPGGARCVGVESRHKS